MWQKKSFHLFPKFGIPPPQTNVMEKIFHIRVKFCIKKKGDFGVSSFFLLAKFSPTGKKLKFEFLKVQIQLNLLFFSFLKISPKFPKPQI